MQVLSGDVRPPSALGTDLLDRPMLVAIPPLVAHGFKGVGTSEALVINVPTRPYDHRSPDEHRIDPDGGEIPYNWSLKNR